MQTLSYSGPVKKRNYAQYAVRLMRAILTTGEWRHPGDTDRNNRGKPETFTTAAAVNKQARCGVVHRRRSSVNFGGQDIFINKMPEFYTIFARKK